jgi:hypothetical protein
LNAAATATLTPSPAVNIIAEASPTFNIGYANTWSAFYAGALWNTAIWNRALLLPDIATLYAAPPVGPNAQQTSTPATILGISG